MKHISASTAMKLSKSKDGMLAFKDKFVLIVPSSEDEETNKDPCV